MTSFNIRVTGQVAAVSAIFESTRSHCKDYLCEDAADFDIRITPEDIAFEREKSVQEDRLEGKPPRSFPDAYLETIAVQRRLAERLFDADVLLFHGSVVAVDGAAYLFTAKSGTGKSTHTKLWREGFGSRAVMINDDKPFLQLTGKEVSIHGSPWSGKHGLDSNIRVPLKGICLLERGAENVIRQAAPEEVRDLLKGFRPQTAEQSETYEQLLAQLLKKVPLWHMYCNTEQDAAIIAYTTMSK